MASPQEMHGKTYKLHNSPGLAPAEALFKSSPVFDGLHNDVKNLMYHVDMLLPEVIKEIATAR